MPATIGDILKTKPELITTSPDTYLHDVLELMIRVVVPTARRENFLAAGGSTNLKAVLSSAIIP